MFEVTTKAANEIRRLISEDDEIDDAFLRVRVVPGGCSGFSYEMGFDDETEDNDQIFKVGDVKVAIDEFSYPYIKGGTLDFKDGLNGTGFHIENPNAVGQCGCGTSFTV
ncbi:MAG: iron-sulfur cluster assembly accessory protein [Candidatus Dadabacteria bacterium]|nr:iron-sulfur cluster assembly accessory protein [Candidatus Dadabacteria bacterium]NIS09805.1 iron-sulfur cluster assembly accessory protein [Candidatus Dadabacteria bacterium]NIV41161.1 iron-sulfur cluster assembly accessory protein [Candidatus Dadabacteria bacterium]NIX16246.1 iron-sulfur cluster assembly accessory protein [Candidatus Dadabacteria bacterium]NIY22866.1 iron-sulfur cluster assembly accessory protein [Candidatus Dadabacteria bacterium]